MTRWRFSSTYPWFKTMISNQYLWGRSTNKDSLGSRVGQCWSTISAQINRWIINRQLMHPIRIRTFLRIFCDNWRTVSSELWAYRTAIRVNWSLDSYYKSIRVFLLNLNKYTKQSHAYTRTHTHTHTHTFSDWSLLTFLPLCSHWYITDNQYILEIKCELVL